MNILVSMKASRRNMSVIIAVLMLLFTDISVWGQRSVVPMQKGYVKTKGRLGNNGTVIAGRRLQGATVLVKGGNAVVSGNNGEFLLTIPTSSYFLQNVQKQGYVLMDPEVLSKQYAWSKNPLILVLENPSQQADDKLTTERRIRKTLQRQLQEKEHEIESLKEQQKLSEEEYRKQLQDIHAQQNNNEQLISEMADRYSKMDFDEIDEFNRRINDCIINGRLIEADSLLRTKGNISMRIDKLLQHHNANMLARATLSKSEMMEQKEREEIANDCFMKFELFKMKNQNDSAVYYIKLRANLDSTNIKWQSEAGKHLSFYALYDEAISFYKTALRYAHKGQVEEVECLLNLGDVYVYKFENHIAINYYSQALSISTSNFGESSLLVAKCYEKLSTANGNSRNFEKALENEQKALSIYKDIHGEIDSDVARVYNSIGVIYSRSGNWPDALSAHLKAWSIREKLFGQMNFDVAVSIYNIGMVYINLGDYTHSLEYLKKSLDIRLQILGKEHPFLINNYISIGQVHCYNKKIEEALLDYKKALNVGLAIYGEVHPEVARCYSEIGMAYSDMKDYNNAIANIKKSLEINRTIYGDNNIQVGIDFNNIGYQYLSAKNYKEALRAYNTALTILSTYQEYTNYINIIKRNIEYIKLKID